MNVPPDDRDPYPRPDSQSGERPAAGRGDELLAAVLAGELSPDAPEVAARRVRDAEFDRELCDLIHVQGRLADALAPSDLGELEADRDAEARFREHAEALLGRELDHDGSGGLGAGGFGWRPLALAAVAVAAALLLWLRPWQQEPTEALDGGRGELAGRVLGPAVENEISLEGVGTGAPLAGRRVSWPERPGCIYRVQLVGLSGGASDRRVLHEEELDVAEFLLPDLPWPPSPATILIEVACFAPGQRTPEITYELDVTAAR